MLHVQSIKSPSKSPGLQFNVVSTGLPSEPSTCWGGVIGLAVGAAKQMQLICNILI